MDALEQKEITREMYGKGVNGTPLKTLSSSSKENVPVNSDTNNKNRKNSKEQTPDKSQSDIVESRLDSVNVTTSSQTVQSDNRVKRPVSPDKVKNSPVKEMKLQSEKSVADSGKKKVLLMTQKQLYNPFDSDEDDGEGDVKVPTAGGRTGGGDQAGEGDSIWVMKDGSQPSSGQNSHDGSVSPLSGSVSPFSGSVSPISSHSGSVSPTQRREIPQKSSPSKA